MGDFANEISKLIEGKSFESIALQSLIEIFGENATQCLIFHMGESALKDPELFEKWIRSLFKAGADLILSHVKYNALQSADYKERKI